MDKDNEIFTILVVEDVEEIRDGIEQLLTADHYNVQAARSDEDAVMRARRRNPNLILLSPGEPGADGIARGRRIRQRADLGEDVPVVIFCVPTLAEGAEVELGGSVYITRPDNFDQLRRLLDRLL
jgi:CheY-like chemotaxis protein